MALDLLTIEQVKNIVVCYVILVLPIVVENVCTTTIIYWPKSIKIYLMFFHPLFEKGMYEYHSVYVLKRTVYTHIRWFPRKSRREIYAEKDGKAGLGWVTQSIERFVQLYFRTHLLLLKDIQDIWAADTKLVHFVHD